MSQYHDSVFQCVTNNNNLVGKVDIHPINDYAQYLNLHVDELGRLSRRELCYANYTLSIYCLSLQDNLNKLKIQLKTTSKEASRLYAKLHTQYNQYIPNDTIYAMACNDNPDLMTLDDKILKLEAMIQSNYGLINQIENVMGTIKSLIYESNRTNT